MHIVTDIAGGFYIRGSALQPWETRALPSTEVFPSFPITRPSFQTYKRRTYISGQYNRLLVVTENKDLVEGGIEALSPAPTVTIGSGTGITASSVKYYYSMAHYEGARLIHESNLSSASAAINIANKNVILTNLPILHDNPRVNFKRIFRSDNGGIPRFVARVQLHGYWPTDPVDYSTYTDSIATLDLGEIRTLNNEVPPFHRFNREFHDRMFYAGNPSFPHLLYYSETGRPEAVGFASTIPTQDGEDITGLGRMGSELLVFCKNAIYKVTGFGPNDFVMKKISTGVGCISHHSIISIDEILWFASAIGVYTYNGSLQFQMDKLRDYWRTAYSNDSASYQDSIAIEDSFYNGYLLLVKQTANAALYFGHYFPVYRGLQPSWVFDSYEKDISRTLGILTTAPGSHIVGQYLGGTHASVNKLYQINIEATEVDADTNKRVTIQTGAQLFGDPGGSKEEGKSFQELWTYVQSDGYEWDFYALGGDEDVISAATPDNSTSFWHELVPASAIAGKTKLGTHYHQPAGVAGRTLSIKVAVSDVADFKYRGYGGAYLDGPAGRPPVT